MPDEIPLLLNEPTGCGLAIVFHKAGDRHRHDVSRSEGGGSILLRSRDTGTAWPSSPPLQQLVRQVRNGHALILGLGTAGTSHWSASFETIEEGATVEVQVACRLGGPASWLGTTYELVGDSVCGEHNPRGIAIDFDGRRLWISPGKGTKAAYDRATRRIAITPDDVSTDMPRTIQWQYRIACQA